MFICVTEFPTISPLVTKHNSLDECRDYASLRSVGAKRVSIYTLKPSLTLFIELESWIDGERDESFTK